MAKGSRGFEFVTVKGTAELMAELNFLTEKLRRKYLRQAAAAGGRVIINAAKANIRSRGTRGKRVNKKGKRIKGLAMSMRLRPSGSWPSAAKVAKQGIVGTSIGFEWPVGAHAHLVEFGHRMVVREKPGPRTFGKGAKREIGFVPPRPFFRPAVDATKAQVLAMYQQRLADALVKEAKNSYNRIKSRG